MKGAFPGSFWDFKVDPKKRVSLPAPYRDELREQHGAEKVVLTITPERCLSGHPAASWPAIVEMSVRWLEHGASGAGFRRLFLALAQEVEPDPHGRIVIPPKLYAFAGMARVVHYVGLGNHFEVWDRDRFDALQGKIDLGALEGPYNATASMFPS